MVMKASLNELKEQLGVYHLGDWSRHTTRMNPASKACEFTYSQILRHGILCHGFR